MSSLVHEHGNEANNPPFDPVFNNSWTITEGVPFLIGANFIKPNKNEERFSNQETEEYHLQFAKWALFNAYDTKHADWIRRTKRNKRFYKGDQWEGTEDLEAFLKDETGKERDRIEITINQIRPMVEQYRGNAILLALGAQAKSISNSVHNRREEALKKALFTTEIAGEFKFLGNIIKEYDGLIGESPTETEQTFDNTWADVYTKNINRLLRFSAELNELSDQQIKVAESLVFSGLGLIEEFEHGGHLRKEAFDPEQFFWDSNATRNDLQDAAYQGRAYTVGLPLLLEKWQKIPKEAKEALENYTANNSSTSNNNNVDPSRSSVGNSIPVYKVYWKDSISKMYGWVEDPFGVPFLVELNVPEELANGTVYTEKDLIEPPNTADNRRIFGNGKKITKKKRRMSVDVIRYCMFVPGEAVNYHQRDRKDKAIDITLEWGLYDYQETNWLDLTNVKYPIKTHAWAYVDGEVLSPIDDIIDPQRFMNRILSAVEGQINASGGSGMVYDKDALDEDEDEDAILRNTKAGNPVGLRTRGKGIPNTFGTYDNTIKAGTYQMFKLFPQLKQMIQDQTGINEALKGESTGSDQLVGVTQLLLQRGSLMQEPFYYAMARVFVQSHQSTATVGKKIYIDNQFELIALGGEEAAEVFKLSVDMMNEHFRVFIKRDAAPEKIRQQADGALTVLLQSQLISRSFFVNHWGRSTLDEIQADLRIQTKREVLAGIKAQKAQDAATAELGAQEEQRFIEANEAADQAEINAELLEEGRREDDKTQKLNEIALTGAAKNQGQAS